MFALALKSTLAKKRRLLSTALSVVLGVAFLSGTLVFTDTIRRTFDDLFADIFASTDTYVRSTTVVELGFGEEHRGRLPESVLDVVRDVDGVSDAQPLVQGFAQLVGSNGRPVGNPGSGAPTFGMNYVSGVLGPWELVGESRAPGPGELVIDHGSAGAGGLRLGDDVTVLTQSGPHVLTLVGTARFGNVDSPGGASVSILDLETAQELLLGNPGEIDAVMVDARPGVSETELTARIAAELPEGAEALTGSQIIDEAQTSLRDAFGFFNTFLLVFAVIGLVVACFTIFNTFQIIVSQRTKEMALMRSIGATRRQVLSAQLLEAVFVGIAAALVGLGLGVVVAGGLKALMSTAGIDIPAGGTVFTARTATVAITVGLLATVVAAVFPSLRASRVPPLAALRDIAVDHSARSGRRFALGGLLTALGLAGFVAGLASSEIAWVGVGSLLTFVGVFVLGPLIARPVTRAVAAPLPVVSGVTGDLARENALRNPKRTARTGGALMVGVAMVIGITVIAANARAWSRDVFSDQFMGDYVVSTDSFGFGGLSTEVADELSAIPEVGVATGIRTGAARNLTAGRDVRYVAIDPATAGAIFDIGMIEGELDRLTSDGVLLEDGAAASLGVGVGSSIEFRFLNGRSRSLVVEGIYTEDELAGSYVVSHAVHEGSGSDQFDIAVYLNRAPGVSDDAARAAIAQVAAPFANANVESRDEYISSQSEQIDQLVNLMYGLLGLAILIALLSIANSIALSINERTRELGLLRAVGMTRRQVRLAVKWEAVLIGVLGTLLGLVIGAGFGWAISVTLRGAGLTTFAIPWLSLAVVSVLAVLGALAASVRPARRAAKLDMLRAISSE